MLFGRKSIFMINKKNLFRIGTTFAVIFLLVVTSVAYGKVTSKTLGVTLSYPKEGDIVNGTITIEWTVIPGDSDIYLYYGLYGGSEWISINEDALHNTDGYRGEHEWDTTTAEYGDGLYEILISTIGGGTNHDSSGGFIINNYAEAPNTPAAPKGPTNVKLEKNYTYTASTTDPDGDQVFYRFRWGESDTISFESEWLGPYDSGVEIETTHSWGLLFFNKTILFKVKAKDTDDMESDWSDPLPITVAKNRQLSLSNFFMIFLESCKNMFPVMNFLRMTIAR